MQGKRLLVYDCLATLPPLLLAQVLPVSKAARLDPKVNAVQGG